MENVYSPLKGKLIDLSDVNDEMFSQRLLGEGVAIIPEDGKVYSPVDGKITMLYETGHAIGIELPRKNEILIHMGIDTVMLKGTPFKAKVKVGDIVHVGDLLTEANWDYIKREGYDPTVCILVMNNKSIIQTEVNRVVNKNEIIFQMV
jgi:PTS system, glucose subfamily, IIA component